MGPAMNEQKPVHGSDTRRLSLESAAGSALGGILTGLVALSLFSLSQSWLLAIAGLLAAAAALGAWGHRRAQRDLALVEAIQNAVDGLSGGASISRIEEADLGSFGSVAHSFNRIFDVLRAVSSRVLERIQGVEYLPEQVTGIMTRIEASAEAQEEAVEETASLLANINSSIRDINERIERLQRSADESASSILEMGSSVDEVTRNVSSLHESVEASTSSVHEMSASIRQVAEGAEQVQHIAESTAASMTQMDRVVQEVTSHAQEAASLTQKVSDGADLGTRAVEDTIHDIERIHERTTQARVGLEKLVSRIGQIGGILGAIGDINDETNLLSLNAAIIAAQAGEQGKAFLVVANHVKTLAKRTAASTQDIEKLILDVQSESVGAVEAMQAGIEAIDTGVQRSRAAGEALAAIRASAREASTRVDGIARATDEQARGSKLVAQAAQDTSSQVQQISSAMTEQNKVSEQMLVNAERALEVCRHVHRSTEEQRETRRYITESISSIAEMIRQIRECTANHAKASESVSEAVTRLLENAHKAGEYVPEVNRMLTQLRDSAREIVGELSRFESTGIGLER
jgi:methyl-accepting chemotaxis protein